jgi:hypothetical protein
MPLERYAWEEITMKYVFSTIALVLLAGFPEGRF